MTAERKIFLLDYIVIDSTKTPDFSIIWMHGLGADGHDFVSIASVLEDYSGLALRFIFPHAPLKPVTLNNGYVMRAWYDITGLTLEARQDEKGLAQSAQSIDELIQHEIEKGFTHQQIILAGFSQGGALALYTALQYKESLAGVIALSAYLPVHQTFFANVTECNKKIPIFMAHGASDSVVALSWAQLAKHQLEKNHYTVEWHTYPMDHQVCQEEIAALGSWLKQCSRKN